MKYLTPHSLKECLDYMMHQNIYDVFSFKWESANDCYYITFLDYEQSMLSLANCPKPRFSVNLKETNEGVIIETKFNETFFQWEPYTSQKNIDDFWKNKLDAVSLYGRNMILECSSPMVYWLGGSTCAGKTTISNIISERFGFEVYHCDEYLGKHIEKSNAQEHPNLNRAV